jgi:hypothetical protein
VEGEKEAEEEGDAIGLDRVIGVGGVGGDLDADRVQRESKSHSQTVRV